MEKNAYEGYVEERLRGNFGEMGSWPLVSKYLEGKKTLDIGCSDGLYLRHMGEGSLGIEQIPALVEASRKRGLNVMQDDVMGGLKSVDTGSFQAVFFSHVMEHLDCPINSLKEINRVLESNGTLVLGLPIEKSFLRQVLGHDYFDGTHLYSFSIRNATKLLELTGFEVVATYYHLPKCRSKLGGYIQKSWSNLPIPWREYFSMAYWLVAKKQN
ncbi:MAG TPA: class I SAM-dependent methyltransferase [Pseudomonadales bacterium]